MTATAVPASTRVWAPEGKSRGTVAVLPGRGEHAGIYERFGRRLAFDGYTVVVDNARAAGQVGVAVDELFAAHPGGARLLVGSDSGALTAWRAAAQGVAVDALVLAGVPLTPPAPITNSATETREAELAARTSCPVHRELLAGDPTFGWGALAATVGPLPDAVPDVPTLLLHGEADPVAPIASVRSLLARWPGAKLISVSDGVHDVLNDQFHRSVAARVVQFVEEVGRAAVLTEQPHEPPRTAEPTRPTRSRKAAPVHVSARLDYAMRAIGQLAGSGPEPIRCESIARAQDIPLNSLVNLMIDLRRSGLVRSHRGCEGGYWLARSAEEITIADVVRAVEGTLVSVHAGGRDSWLWERLGQTVTELLEAWTLAGVASQAATEKHR